VEVLERYLQAVRSWLPKVQQDDIVAELAVDLRAQIEEAEAERGRPLAQGELEALLKRRGHPLWVAEAYLPQQHLIGPALLPSYRLVLKIALGSLLAVLGGVYVVLGLVLRVKGVSSDFGGWLWLACLYGFAQGGLITLIFARLDRSQRRARAAGEWDPRHPGDLPVLAPDPEAERRRKRRLSAVGELVGSGVFALFWLGVARGPATPGVSFWFTSVWRELYWPILTLALADVVLAAGVILRPGGTRLAYGLGLARDSFALVLLGRLLVSGPWVAVAVPGFAPGDLARLAGFLSMVNVSVAITLALLAAFYLAGAVRDARGALGWQPARAWWVRFLAGE
jgi:hypothetical protein